MTGRVPPPGFGRDHRTGTGAGDVGADLVGVVAAIRQELVETAADRSE
ncbi:hypothetical protein NF685_02770 [Asaia lannensis NBRC 102526]|uniref:Uncharacterized protein n=1 Tax=Asaia lannensis NBRC 102526 TaxID=1307926 RepID=A0ABT1CDM4_9PROT|nr:hypothetical protein [Asaia lannensis]MCO6158951.1 hypothetical protein [Asaia lannensis NBRC 102526]